MSDRLKRETDPPVGRIASPVPQYWNPDTGAYEKIHGKNGGANYVDAMEIRGLSSDVKPTTDVYVGTMFIEVATGTTRRTQASGLGTRATSARTRTAASVSAPHFIGH